MKRAALVLLFLLLPLTVLAAADRDLALAERRVALVIGNGAYRNFRQLDCAVNDAEDMAVALEKLGFTVIKKTNATRQEMREAIRQFLVQKKRGSVGLFYYSGHGLQVDGIIYLLPVDADIKALFDIEDQCLRADYVLRAMEEADNRLNIAILDTDQNNPFRTETKSNFEQRMVMAPKDSVLALATSPGSVAYDGQGRNGLYTSKLLVHMFTPGLELLDMFSRVRNDVMAESEGRQVPWENQAYLQRLNPFFFVPTSVAADTEYSEKSADEERRKLETERQLLAEEKAKLEEEKKRIEDARLAIERRRLAIGETEQRVALVIGNSNYTNFTPLPNPQNDATDMAAVLEGCGFDVLKHLNANRWEMRRATHEFMRRIKKGGVGLFFYAGHGLQIDGVNYLVPVNADIRESIDIDDQCLKANYILRAMEEADNRLNIIILDACRNNPFATSRDLSRGLAQMDPPRGSVLAFATSPNDIADDGEGRNGLYTSALLKHLPTPGLSLIDMFIRVRKDVVAESGGRQVPWENQSLMGKFYFVPTSGGVIPGLSDGWDDEEEQRLETERRRLAEEKAKLEEEKKRLEEEKLAEERRRLEEEKAKIEAEKNRLEEERRQAEEQARLEEERRRKEAESKKREFTNSLGQKFVFIKAGTFMMGSPISEAGRDNDENQRVVSIFQPFFMQTTEVTVGQWRDFVNAVGYRTQAEKDGYALIWTGAKWEKSLRANWRNSGFDQTDEHPVTCVSWDDVSQFIFWINQKDRERVYRLPSEAEWEYACRAGAASPLFNGPISNLGCGFDKGFDYVGWYCGNSNGCSPQSRCISI